MDFQTLGRMVSLVIAAVVLFGLQMAFSSPIYVAIPAGIAAYTVSRLAFALIAVRKS
jgi:hypothetical protein